jgi:SAM-dependent methyltransferase
MIASRDYLDAQKASWDVDERLARLGRVDTVSKNEAEYEERANQDFELVFRGLDHCIGSESTILEIGCGVGRLLSRLLARKTPKLVIGVDISAGMIAHARNALGERDDLILMVNSGADLSLISTQSIDLVVCNDVFIHIHDIDVIRNYLAECKRILKPSGVLRFNVRQMLIGKMFANTPGGLLAKISYATGIRSSLKKSGHPIPGFDGLQFRKHDIRRLLRDAELIGQVDERDDGGRLWCTCRPA